MNEYSPRRLFFETTSHDSYSIIDKNTLNTVRAIVAEHLPFDQLSSFERDGAIVREGEIRWRHDDYEAALVHTQQNLNGQQDSYLVLATSPIDDTHQQSGDSTVLTMSYLNLDNGAFSVAAERLSSDDSSEETELTVEQVELMARAGAHKPTEADLSLFSEQIHTMHAYMEQDKKRKSKISRFVSAIPWRK